MKNRIYIVLLPFVLLFGFMLTLWQVFAQNDSQTRISAANHSPDNQVLLKQYGGSAYAVTRYGNYAYLLIGSRLEVLDISDPVDPIYLSQTPIFSSTYFIEMVITGTAGYLAANNQLQIFDLSDPVNPTVTAVFPIPSRFINKMMVSGNLLILGEYKNSGEFPGYGGLRIIDISNPFNPIELSHYANGSTVNAIAVKDDVLYMGACVYNNAYSCSREFTILDISNPASPQEISAAYAGRIDDLDTYGDYLYHVETSDDDIRIFDISNPSTPTYLNSVGFPDNGLSHELKIDGQYAYLTSFNGIRAYTLTNPITPTYFASYDPNGIFSIMPNNDYIYIAQGSDGLIIADITPPVIDEVARYQIFSWPTDIAEAGGYVYLLDSIGLHILDVSDPLNPAEVNLYNHQNTSHERLIISGTLGIKANRYGQRNFEIIDISDPLSPTHQSFYTAQGNNVFETILQGNYVYLAIWDDIVDDLEIVDISDPTQPMLISSINITQSSRHNFGIEISGDYAYMVESRGGSNPNDQLTIIDISNKMQPEVVATQPVTYANNDEFGKSLTLLNEHAFVGGFGVRIFDVTDPLAPTPVGIYTIANAIGYNYGVESQNGYLYVSAPLENGFTAMHILDVSNPANPVKIGDYQYLGELIVSAGEDDYIYAAERELGLSIYGAGGNANSDFKAYLPLALRNP